jgi:hypothetical protein
MLPLAGARRLRDVEGARALGLLEAAPAPISIWMGVVAAAAIDRVPPAADEDEDDKEDEAATCKS